MTDGTQSVDHLARAEIRTIAADLARVAAVIEALRERIERDGALHSEAVRAQSKALEALAEKFGADQVASAFLRGQTATKWAMMGFAISTGFMILGGIASWLMTKAFGPPLQ